jgi:tetratricopeptide (TPR) repeat protein
VKRICLLGILAALNSGAQLRTGAALTQMSFAGAFYFADRHARIVDPNDGPGTTHSRNAPPPLTVSLAQLKHKIPKEALKAFKRGQELSEAGNHDLAAKELEKAITLDPEFAEARAALGVDYAQLMRFDEAAAELKRSIALDPSSSGYYNLGLVYFQTGDMEAAETSVRKALQLPQSQPTTHLLLAYILMPDPTKREEAERHLRLAARTIPQAGYLLSKLQESPPHS